MFFIVPNQIPGSPVPVALSPRLFCQIATVLIIVLSAIFMVNGFYAQTNNQVDENKLDIREKIRVIISILCAIAYVFFIPIIGYFFSTIITLLFFLLFFGARKWLPISLTVIVITIFVYLFFTKALRVVFPSGILF
jgi:hypothetical protein